MFPRLKSIPKSISDLFAMKCCVVTLGCQMNQSDSERIRSVIEKMGYEMTEVEEEASLIGVVACSVRQKAIDKVYSKIHKWNKWKNDKPLVTFVSGCILPADELKFLKLSLGIYYSGS